MSLSRFTLRALATAALLPQPGDVDLITMAGDYVFPDELNPLQFREAQKDLPAITIYTDEDLSEMRNQDNSRPFKRVVQLRIELTVGSFEMIEGSPTYSVDFTSQELEARLDFFEQQVRWALFSWPRPMTSAFRRFVVRNTSIQSHPVRDSENNKLSSRRLTMTCDIPDDCPPNFQIGGVLPGVVTITKAMFPATPWLADMFVAMQNQPSYRAVLDILGKTGHPAMLLPLLKRFGVVADPIHLGGANAAALAAAGQTPDHGGHPVVETLIGEPL